MKINKNPPKSVQNRSRIAFFDQVRSTWAVSGSPEHLRGYPGSPQGGPRRPQGTPGGAQSRPREPQWSPEGPPEQPKVPQRWENRTRNIPQIDSGADFGHKADAQTIFERFSIDFSSKSLQIDTEIELRIEGEFRKKRFVEAAIDEPSVAKPPARFIRKNTVDPCTAQSCSIGAASRKFHAKSTNQPTKTASRSDLH